MFRHTGSARAYWDARQLLVNEEDYEPSTSADRARDGGTDAAVLLSGVPISAASEAGGLNGIDTIIDSLRGEPALAVMCGIAACPAHQNQPHHLYDDEPARSIGALKELTNQWICCH